MSQLYEEALSAQEQGHVEQAEQLFQKVISQAQNPEDIVLQQRCLVQLVAIAQEKEDTHGQVRWLKKNYNITKKHNSRQAARLCLDLSLVFLKDGDFAASKMWSKKAFDRSQEEWDKEVMAESQLLMGMSFYRENRPEDARVLFRRANIAYEEIKHEEGTFKSLFHMGLVHHQLSDFSRARSIFLKCLEQSPEEAVPLVADLHLRLTLISMELGFHIDALFHALASLGRYRRLGSPRQDRVWEEIFRIRGFLDPKEFEDQVQSHLNEEGTKKFMAMSEAVALRFQKELEEAQQEARQQREQEEAQKREKEAYLARMRQQEQDLREAEETTTPMERVFHNEETVLDEHTDVPNLPNRSSEPPVVELEIFEQEVQDDSVETEFTWREDPIVEETKRPIKNIVLLFVGVFFFVFGSLYVISLLQ